MKWFYNLGINSKLIIGFVLVTLIAGITGVIGVINMKTVETGGKEMYSNNLISVQHVMDILNAYQKNRVLVRELVFDQTVSEKDEHIKKINEMDEIINKSLLDLEAIKGSGDEKEDFNNVKRALDNWKPIREKAIKLAMEDKDEEAIAFMRGKEVNEGAKALDEAFNNIQDNKVQQAAQKAKENAATSKSSMTMMITLIAFSVLTALTLGIFISNTVSRPVKILLEASEKVAKGELDVSINIHTRDELGRLSEAYREMTDNINGILTNINTASEQVSSGARQVAASSQALSQGSTEQASAIEEINASIMEVAAQTKLNASNANQANDLAVSAKKSAIQGNVQMKEMLKAMVDINEASSNISKIIKVIDEIAFQTNILALNAAVEAARAGQHGKGFAVVAEEVRNLAARSANAAKETTDMIEGSIKKVNTGTRIANDTASALSSIVDEVERVANLVGEIASASNQQATGIAQVNQAISQVAQVVQINSATSEESAAASEELSSQADLLKEEVSKFKLKKTHGGTYKNFENINPDIIRMMEDMSEKKEK